MADSERISFLFKFDLKGVFNAIVHYLYGLSSYKEIKLQRFYIYPTAKCNDRCVYCGEYWRGENIQEIEFFESKNYIDRLIFDIKELKLKEVHLLGRGDPFFYKDNMLYFLEELKNTDVFIKMLTNANNLTDKDIEKIVKDGLISSLALNLNADSTELARKLYLNGERHEHTLFILESISKYKKLYNKRYPLIDIFFVLFNMNYNKIPNIISLLKKFDISFFFIQPLRIYKDEHKSLKLTEEQQMEFEERLPSIERVLEEANIKSNTNDFKINRNFIENTASLQCVIPSRTLLGINKLACYLPLTSLSIYPDGAIHKCMYLDDAYKNNYFSISSLKDFIRSKEVTDFIMKFIENEDLPMCKNCNSCVLNEVEEIKKGFRQLKALDKEI